MKKFIVAAAVVVLSVFGFRVGKQVWFVYKAVAPLAQMVAQDTKSGQTFTVSDVLQVLADERVRTVAAEVEKKKAEAAQTGSGK